jgi:hypothetical protein
MAAPRPYTQAEQTLRGLACQTEGFGRQAMGGLHGDVYHVTTLDGILFFFLFRARDGGQKLGIIFSDLY